jgi:hypothetical protein
MIEDEDPLLRELRILAADYEPSVASIERWVRFPDRIEAGNPTLLTDPLRLVVEPTPPAHRSRRALLLPAAAVLLLFGGVVLAGSLRGPDPGRTGTSTLPIGTAVPAATTPARAIPSLTSPPEPSTPERPAKPSTDRSAPVPPATSDRTAKARRPDEPVTVSVRAVAPGTPVDLSRPPLTDWLAVGTRSDLKQVRAKAGSGTLGLEQPESATSVPGPFTVSWTDGLPEQSHDNALDWLQADAEPGLTATLAAAGKPRTVILYAGTRDLHGTLTVTSPGLATTETSFPAAGPDASSSPVATGWAVTLTLPPTSSPTHLHLSGTPDGPNPTVQLAAVTVG